MGYRYSGLMVALGLCANGLVQAAGPAATPPAAGYSATGEQDGPLPLPSAVPPATDTVSNAETPAQAAPAPHSPAAKLVLEKYYAEQYREAGRSGLAVLADEPNNAELRFIVANSLAWSGYTRDALTQYAALEGSDFHDRAVLGLAHVNRWTGRPDRAATAYREVLQHTPGNQDAIDGLRLANRELRPKTGLTIGHADNSNDASRVWTGLSHRWRRGSGAEIVEITAGRLEEEKDNLRVTQRDLSLRYENLDGFLAPRVELSLQESPRTRVFGTLALKVADTPATIEVGHINWGKLAFDPSALRDGLTANQLGGNAEFRNMLGSVAVAYNAYRVSDSNLVQHLNLRVTPSRQPFSTPHVRVFGGIEARKARFFDSRYWSPEEGHYNAFAGIGADWSNERWQTYGSVQYGVPLTGESGKSWSTGVGLKRWLGENWAASIDFWAINTPRDGGYKATSATARIEMLW